MKIMSYTMRALRPKYVPYPQQYRNMEMLGYGPRVVPFNVRLAMYLDEHNITANKFAHMCSEKGERLGVIFYNTYIYRYLDGVCAPKSEKLAVIAEVMGTSEQYVTGYTHYSHKGFSATTKPNFRDGEDAA